MSDRIVIDGSSLTCAQVARAGRGRGKRRGGPGGRRRGAPRPGRWPGRWPRPGRSTAGPPGWAPTATVLVAAAEAAQHGLHLLRSHAAGAGPLLDPDLARAMLVVRLNQIGAGGSGVDPGVLDVLADAINRGFVPPVPRYGAIGTGDLTALAATGLCLLGERDWLRGQRPAAALRAAPGRSARLPEQQRRDARRGRAGLRRPGPAEPGGGAHRGPVAARGTRVSRAVRGRGAAGPAAPRPAVGRRGRPRPDRGAARAAGPASRTRTATGRSRRCTARPLDAVAHASQRGHRGHQRGQREPAGRPGRAHRLAQRQLPRHLCRVGPGRGPGGAVPDRGAGCGPARHAGRAGLHRPGGVRR